MTGSVTGPACDAIRKSSNAENLRVKQHAYVVHGFMFNASLDRRKLVVTYTVMNLRDQLPLPIITDLIRQFQRATMEVRAV